MSYLDFPRLHFSGFFQADVSTINNDVRFFDVAGFQEKYQDWTEGNWHPEGTAIFRLLDCAITGANLGGHVLTNRDDDPVIGMTLQNADARVSGKLVDLDPQQQMVSEIWGMRVRLTNGVQRDLFAGGFAVTPFINLWQRQQKNSAPIDQTLAAMYQSVLEGVSWEDDCGSAVLEALRKASEDGLLSMAMNVYGYGRDPMIPRYTIGHVAGSIGPYRNGEPKRFVIGRQMASPATKIPNNPFVPNSGIFWFTCKVHKDRNFVTADFGNCLQIVDANGGFEPFGQLQLAVYKADAPALLTTVDASQVAILGEVGYQQPGWYAQTSGVQDFNYGDDSWVAQNIGRYPLVLLGPASGSSYPVLVQETLGGGYVRADNFVCRLQAGETQTLDLYASQWGEPLAKANIVTSVTTGYMGGTGGGDEPLHPFVPTPDVLIPADAISYAPSVPTDGNGKAQLAITARPAGPGNPRGYIDGQLYGIAYQLSTQPAGYVANSFNYISVLAFDAPTLPVQPTWYADIQPIFQQYGNLYPIMSKHLVRLGDYDSVCEHLAILRLAFSLPRDNPNHMPVTRDLSEAKRDLILQWIDTKGPDGLPIKGEPVPQPLHTAMKTVEVPLAKLAPEQKGGKMAVMLNYQARQSASKEPS